MNNKAPRRRRYAATAACALIALISAYVVMDQMITAKIRHDLHVAYGDDYAVLAMRMGGAPVREPSLWKFLRLLFDYNCTDRYPPQGSGMFTGKKNYLLMLVGDNKVVRNCHWSFRQWGLVSDPGIQDCDIITNMVPALQPVYRFDPGNRSMRRGIWLTGESFNSDETEFYWRPLANQPPGSLPETPLDQG